VPNSDGTGRIKLSQHFCRVEGKWLLPEFFSRFSFVFSKNAGIRPVSEIYPSEMPKRLYEFTRPDRSAKVTLVNKRKHFYLPAFLARLKPLGYAAATHFRSLPMPLFADEPSWSALGMNLAAGLFGILGIFPHPDLSGLVYGSSS
jgi:hypothetical protein